MILHGVAEELRRNYPGSRFSAYCHDRKSYRYLRRSGFPYEGLEVISDYIADNWSIFEPDLKYLRAMEELYGVPNLWLYVTADREISRYSYLDILRMLEGHFRFITDFFSRERPDAVVGPKPAGMSSYISYVVARRMGIKFAPLTAGRPGTVWFMHPDGEITGVKERYSHYMSRPLTAQARQQAEGFLEEFRREERKLGDLHQRLVRPPRLRFNPRRVWQYFHDYYIVGRGREFTLPGPGAQLARKLTRFSRHLIGRSTRVFDVPDDKEAFVLFPLQVTPEASTLVHAPFYVDQSALVENIARSLPIGYKLYVKEHPVNIWTRPLAEYRRLRRLPNVRVIAPTVDSHTLIRSAAAVVTITSTVGWEAILLEKPVIVLGNYFTKNFEGAYYVRSVADLPEALQHAVKSFRADRERILRYLLAIMDCSYPGKWELSPAGTDSANIRLLARAVAHEVGLGGNEDARDRIQASA
jgi:hypothetical protein